MTHYEEAVINQQTF